MAASPSWADKPNFGGVTLTAANNTYDGTGTVGTVLTAGGAGALTGVIKAKPNGTNASITVARFFVNNGGSNAVAANNILIGEMALPSTAASATAPLVEIGYPFSVAVQAGNRILVVLGTAVAGGWTFSIPGGNL